MNCIQYISQRYRRSIIKPLLQENKIIKCCTCRYSSYLDKNSEDDREKALSKINKADFETLSKYTITKKRLENLIEWRTTNERLNSLEELKNIHGFTPKTAEKFIESIIDKNVSSIEKLVQSKFRGQILYPTLTEDVRKRTETIAAIHLTINSVSWSLLQNSNYELKDWGYYNMQVPEGKKLLMSDLYEMSWEIFSRIPKAELYVMEAPVTMLRATGSDPQNPKVLTINLQKTQVTSMLVALLNSSNAVLERDNVCCEQSVYFLRQSLSARVFRNFVGNEKVSSENTVTEILSKSNSHDDGQLFVPQNLIKFFESRKDLDKETLGQSLLLALTFMDLCFYKNIKTLEKLVNK